MDMELHLARSDARQTEVSVTCNGALSHTFDLRTLMPASTPGLLHPIRDPVTYGKALYAALFAPDSLAEQALAAKPSRILLVALDEELDALPWEYAPSLVPAAVSRVAARLCAGCQRSNGARHRSAWAGCTSSPSPQARSVTPLLPSTFRASGRASPRLSGAWIAP
ncbi:MAG: hypothetical protein ABI456_25390 [Ktedonobacteraceae bacterium]